MEEEKEELCRAGGAIRGGSLSVYSTTPRKMRERQLTPRTPHYAPSPGVKHGMKKLKSCAVITI
jgi:hypothetical protein